MKIVHLSDLHLVEPGKSIFGSEPALRLDRALALVKRDHADAAFCLLTGDLADAGDPAAYAELARQLAQLPMPCHLIPGNHDQRHALRAVLPGLTFANDGFLQQRITTPVGQWLLLDTADAGSTSGRYCARRRDWLATQLAESGTAPLFIAMHHPPFSVGLPAMDQYRLADFAEFHALIAPHRARIRHLLIGHLHRPLGGTWQGIGFSGVSSPNHQVAFDMKTLPASGDVPGCAGHPGLGVIAIDKDTVVVHHQFLYGDDAEFLM